MNHIIIGAGVIGKATGKYLEAQNEKVWYYDKNTEICNKLEKDKKLVTYDLEKTHAVHKIDYFWICTAEWNVDEVLKMINELFAYPKVIIRSTISPTQAEDYTKNLKFKFVHVPEFLREATATQDVFNNDRIVIGSTSDKLGREIANFFYGEKIIHCSPVESSLVKLIANNWLSMQISFWNEMYELMNAYDNTNPQLIANAVTSDRRISKYGSALIHKPFGGFCFPKDTQALALEFKQKQLGGYMIAALRIVNEMIA